jgi:hypothetical protein
MMGAAQMVRILQLGLRWMAWLACVGVVAVSVWYGYWNVPGGSVARLAGLRAFLAPLAAAYGVLLIVGLYIGLRGQERFDRGEGA